jgi:hypothetical protein
MMLSCEYDYEPEPGDVCWRCPSKWRAYDFKRARKCCSCGEKIKKGDTGKDYIEFERYKVPEYDVELRIYGETTIRVRRARRGSCALSADGAIASWPRQDTPCRCIKTCGRCSLSTKK